MSWRLRRLQAAAEGDALKADKRRKKKKREAEVDAIFGADDEDDGGDYNPWVVAQEEQEASDGSEPPEPEDEAPGNGSADNPLKGTGEPAFLLGRVPALQDRQDSSTQSGRCSSIANIVQVPTCLEMQIM